MGRTILHQKLKGYYDLKITEKMITRQCRELPNWESTGFDEVLSNKQKGCRGNSRGTKD